MNPGAFLLLLICTLLMLTIGLNFNDSLAQGASIKNLLLYGMVVWYAGDILRGRARALPAVGPVHNTYMVLGLWAILATFVAFGMGVSTYALSSAALVWKNEFFDTIAILLVTGVVIRNSGTAYVVLRCLVLGIAGLAALTVLEAALPAVHIFGLFIESSEVAGIGRPKGPFGEPNQTAAVLAMLLPIALSLAMPKGSFRLVYLGAATMLLAAIVVTGSRGGLAGAAAGSLVLMFLLRRNFGMGGKLLVLLSLPLLGVLAWAVVPHGAQERVEQRVGAVFGPNVNAENASAGRTMIWGRAIDLWLKQPVSGIGWTGFRAAARGATHNEYVRYLAETGIIGLGMYLVLWWRVFACLSVAPGLNPRVPFVRAGALAGTIGLLTSIFFVNLYQPWLIVWCVLGVLMAYLSFERIDYARKVEQDKAEKDRAAKGKAEREARQSPPTRAAATR